MKPDDSPLRPRHTSSRSLPHHQLRWSAHHIRCGGGAAASAAASLAHEVTPHFFASVLDAVARAAKAEADLRELGDALEAAAEREHLQSEGRG